MLRFFPYREWPKCSASCDVNAVNDFDITTEQRQYGMTLRKSRNIAWHKKQEEERGKKENSKHDLE